MKKIALVAGSTGLVGGHIIRQLAAHSDYQEIITLCRTTPTTDWANHEKVTVKVIDFDQLEQELAGISIDEVYCALGTTAKKSPSKQQYQKADMDYPIALAKAGLAANASYFGLVSAIGANKNSPSSYSRYKGNVEHFLTQSSYKSVAIAQPSLLLGERNEYRLGESLLSIATPLMPKAIKSIKGDDVAGALINAANSNYNGVNILSNKVMHGQAFT